MSSNPGWKQVQQMDESEQKALQDRLLAELIQERVYPFSSYYRGLFDREGVDPASVKSIEDLTRVPLTSKQDILPSDADPDSTTRFVLSPSQELIRAHWPLRKELPLLCKGLLRGRDAVREDLRREYYPCFMTFTTGRSAQPVPFLYSKHDLDELADAGRRLTEILGYGPDWRVLNLFPYAPHLAFWQVAQANFETGILVLSTGGGKVTGTEGNLRALDRLKPNSIVGVPGYLYHLLREALKQGHVIEHCHSVVLGADTVQPGLKTKLRGLLAEMGSPEVDMLGTYGFTEARMAFAECPTRDGSGSGYHYYPDKGIFEIVDPETGESLPLDRDGELVYTPLTGRGTTVLRYRTDDLVEGGIATGPCPHCGRTLPRISSRLKRVSSVRSLSLKKIKGTLVDLEEVGHVLANDLDVEEWQVVIRKKDEDPLEVDELVLLVALKAGVQQSSARDRLSNGVKAATEVTPNEINFLSIDEVLAAVGMEVEMKEKRILDLRTEA